MGIRKNFTEAIRQTNLPQFVCGSGRDRSSYLGAKNVYYGNITTVRCVQWWNAIATIQCCSSHTFYGSVSLFLGENESKVMASDFIPVPLLRIF